MTKLQIDTAIRPLVKCTYGCGIRTAGICITWGSKKDIKHYCCDNCGTSAVTKVDKK